MKDEVASARGSNGEVAMEMQVVRRILGWIGVWS
jgi:hypothetical protein